MTNKTKSGIINIKEVKEVGIYQSLDQDKIFTVDQSDLEPILVARTWLYYYEDENDRKVYVFSGKHQRPELYEDLEVKKLDWDQYQLKNNIVIENKPTYKERFNILQDKINKIIKLCEKEQKTFIRITDGMRTYCQESESAKFAKKVIRYINK